MGVTLKSGAGEEFRLKSGWSIFWILARQHNNKRSKKHNFATSAVLLRLSTTLYQINTIMKSFQAVIIAALAVSSAAINEPVASPTAAIERELAEYERQLGDETTAEPTWTIGVSYVWAGPTTTTRLQFSMDHRFYYFYRHGMIV